jgi:hypothetical protein
MSIFELEQAIHDKGGDLAEIRQKWMDISDEKGWPKTETGWQRYLQRAFDQQSFPSRKSSTKARNNDPLWSTDVPGEFLEWMEGHRELCSKHEDGRMRLMNPITAWNAKPYRDQWKEWKALADRKAA